MLMANLALKQLRYFEAMAHHRHFGRDDIKHHVAKSKVYEDESAPRPARPLTDNIAP